MVPRQRLKRKRLNIEASSNLQSLVKRKYLGPIVEMVVIDHSCHSTRGPEGNPGYMCEPHFARSVIKLRSQFQPENVYRIIGLALIIHLKEHELCVCLKKPTTANNFQPLFEMFGNPMMPPRGPWCTIHYPSNLFEFIKAYAVFPPF